MKNVKSDIGSIKSRVEQRCIIDADAGIDSAVYSRVDWNVFIQVDSTVNLKVIDSVYGRVYNKVYGSVIVIDYGIYWRIDRKYANNESAP